MVPKFGLLWKSRKKLPWQVPAPQRWFSTEELQSGDLGRKWLDLPNELVLFHNCWKKMFARRDIAPFLSREKVKEKDYSLMARD